MSVMTQLLPSPNECPTCNTSWGGNNRPWLCKYGPIKKWGLKSKPKMKHNSLGFLYHLNESNIYYHLSETFFFIKGEISDMISLFQVQTLHVPMKVPERSTIWGLVTSKFYLSTVCQLKGTSPQKFLNMPFLCFKSLDPPV